VLPSTIPLVITIWYRMVLDFKYHRIYGTIESMVPAQLWAGSPKLQYYNIILSYYNITILSYFLKKVNSDGQEWKNHTLVGHPR